MLVLKKHITNVIHRHLSESLNSEKETDLSVDYFSLDTDSGICLYRDDSSLSFNFFDDSLFIEIKDPASPVMRIDVNEMSELKLLQYAIDLLVKLFVNKNWHMSVGILSVSNLWEFAESYKNGTLDLSEGFPVQK
ncbi:Uncharacterised protein [Streptococcus pneumoniae]|nr:Uncharacterised protein [Streptococcus pneumoniae]